MNELHLRDLNPLHGKEMSIQSDGERVTISAVILTCEDLVIKHNVELQFSFPLQYASTGGMILKTRNVSDFTECLYFSSDTREFSFPWLETHRSHPSVWFYTVRELVKKAGALYITPVEVTRALPVISLQLHDAKNIQGISLMVSSGRTKGRRPYMEDVDFAFDSVMVGDRKAISVYGVLDGHGGKECAVYASEEIPTKIAAFMRKGEVCQKALFNAFLATDDEFISGCGSRESSGSTACVLVWDSRQCLMTIANTGDTRAVLCRSGKAINLTRDKKTSDPEEQARIYKEGGVVVNGRVQGILAITRALGDCQLKLTKGKRVLIPDPEITALRPNCDHQTIVEVHIAEVDSSSEPTKSDGYRRMALDESPVQDSSTTQTREGDSVGGSVAVGGPAMDEFIIIASDGLWDVMSSQTAVQKARSLIIASETIQNAVQGLKQQRQLSSAELEEAKKALGRVAYLIAKDAYILGSQDNVTVMIIMIIFGLQDVPIEVRVRENAEQSFILGDSAEAFAKYQVVKVQSEGGRQRGPSIILPGSLGVSDEFYSCDDTYSAAPVHDGTHTTKSQGSSVDDIIDEKDLLDFLNDDANF